MDNCWRFGNCCSAFFGTTVHQVSLRWTVNSHRRVEVDRTLRLGSSTCLVKFLMCIASLVHRDVRAYTWSTSRSAAAEQNKSAVTDHAISFNHVIDWDHAKVIDRESSRMDWWIREAMHVRKEQDKLMNQDDGSQGRCYFFIRQVIRRSCLLPVMGAILFLFVVPIERLP